MRHAIITDIAGDGDTFEARNECSCGWKGNPRDAAARAEINAEARAHKWVHATAKAMFVVMVTLFAAWVIALGIGAAWLFRGMAGW